MSKFQGVLRDPLQAFRYRIVVPKFGSVAGFSTVSGLHEESEVVEYREGNDPSTARKLPGLTSFDPITLEKGVALDTVFQLWRNEVFEKALDSDGLPQPQGAAVDDAAIAGFRRDLWIEIYGKGANFDPGQVAVRFYVKDAWPSMLEYGDLDAASSDVLIETMQLAHEGCYRELFPQG